VTGAGSPRRPVGSVARAVALLEALSDSGAGLGVNELARRIGVNASTASRLLSTLEAAGIVQRSGAGPYRLGLRLVHYADRVLGQLDVRQLARPLLAGLAARTGETATLSVPSGGEAVTVDFVPAGSSVVSMARLGRPSILHATAVGKVVLAFEGSSGGSVGAAGAGPLTAFTDRTIVDAGALATEVGAVRERGYAEAVGERESDLVAVAAPVFGRGGELAAILGIQGPLSRMSAAVRRAVRGPLIDAATELGGLIGGVPRADGPPPGPRRP
jgi:IclR family acetate operon transcriptional repressor